MDFHREEVEGVASMDWGGGRCESVLVDGHVPFSSSPASDDGCQDNGAPANEFLVPLFVINGVDSAAAAIDPAVVTIGAC
jgi:hypothetical protein